MTSQERAILQEAEDQAFDTSQQLYNPLSSGIRPPPTIEETESSIEGQLFGFEFGSEPQAQAFPGASAPPPTAATGACCADDGTCTVTTEADCTGTYQGDGTDCDPNPCTGACCHFDGTCTDVAPFLCTAPSIFLGLFTTCDTSRCEGACAICDTCNSACTCYNATTYVECQAMIPAHGGSGWLLNGNCIDNDCAYFGCTYNSVLGACCAEGACLDDQTESACAGFGGTFWQAGISCDNAIACGHSECG